MGILVNGNLGDLFRRYVDEVEMNTDPENPTFLIDYGIALRQQLVGRPEIAREDVCFLALALHLQLAFEEPDRLVRWVVGNSLPSLDDLIACTKVASSAKEEVTRLIRYYRVCDEILVIQAILLNFLWKHRQQVVVRSREEAAGDLYARIERKQILEDEE